MTFRVLYNHTLDTMFDLIFILGCVQLPHPSQDSCPFARCDPKLQLVRKHLWRCAFLQWISKLSAIWQYIFLIKYLPHWFNYPNILWTSLGLQHIGMELPREIDTKVLKLGFYMFLYGLHWVNLGGGYPWSLTTCQHVSTAAERCWPQNSWLEYVGIRNKCNQFCGSQLITPHFEQRKIISYSISLVMWLLAEDGAGNSGCSKLWANLAGRGRLDNLKITSVKRNTTFLQNPWT